MARTIKKIAHDLLPLSDAVTELSAIVAQLLHVIEQHASFSEETTKQYFYQGIKALDKLTLSADLIKTYLHELNEEADREGISKDD